MLAEARTVKEAARTAAATGGVHLPGKEPGKFSPRVLVTGDFEAHRAAVEAVTVLSQLSDDDGKQVPSGWSVTGASFEVEWPKDPSVVRSHSGARRFAYNWALGQVKADLDAKEQGPEHEPVPWGLPALRKRWDRDKPKVAPWWAESSKECYSAGTADPVKALSNWSSSKQGKRKGRKVGFPKFKSRHRDQPRGPMVGSGYFGTPWARMQWEKPTAEGEPVAWELFVPAAFKEPPAWLGGPPHAAARRARLASRRPESPVRRDPWCVMARWSGTLGNTGSPGPAPCREERALGFAAPAVVLPAGAKM